MGSWALLLYMLVYAFMNLGAFGFVILLESKGYAGEVIGDYAGLARRTQRPRLGMLIFMLAWAASRRPRASWASSTCSRRRWRPATSC
jgi:NADH-quinone oxidoreductase subunit N